MFRSVELKIIPKLFHFFNSSQNDIALHVIWSKSSLQATSSWAFQLLLKPPSAQLIVFSEHRKFWHSAIKATICLPTFWLIYDEPARDLRDFWLLLTASDSLTTLSACVGVIHKKKSQKIISWTFTFIRSTLSLNYSYVLQLYVWL